MKRVERFSSDFPADVTDALSHYDAIATDLGNRFRDALKSTLDQIRERPESFGYTEPPTRGAMLSRFPYVVVFRVSENLLQFGGVFHSASDPSRWQARMGPS
jgi:hypothetical protein